MEEKSKEIIKNRCDNDPIYSLIYAPHDDDFINQMIELCILVICKRYGDTISKDKSISYMFKLLREVKDDDVIKRFAIIFFINWETDLCKAVVDMYGDKGLFEENGKQHFHQFIGRMNAFVEKTIRFPYSKYNIIELINNVDDSVKKEYLMGPFE